MPEELAAIAGEVGRNITYDLASQVNCVSTRHPILLCLFLSAHCVSRLLKTLLQVSVS